MFVLLIKKSNQILMTQTLSSRQIKSTIANLGVLQKISKANINTLERLQLYQLFNEELAQQKKAEYNIQIQSASVLIEKLNSLLSQ
jgi:hypothetical protein